MLAAGMWLLGRSNRVPTQPLRSVPDRDLEYKLKIAELEYQAALKKVETALLGIKDKPGG